MKSSIEFNGYCGDPSGKLCLLSATMLFNITACWSRMFVILSNFRTTTSSNFDFCSETVVTNDDDTVLGVLH